MGYPAVFLDKDGTLIPDIPYNVDPAKIELAAGAGRALRSLSHKGYKFIVISNQSGVARGYFAESALVGVKERLQALLHLDRVTLSGFYYCPHHPTGALSAGRNSEETRRYAIDCLCRKPKPGLILKAAKDHDIDLSQSWMIGDILNDVEAGRKAGCKTILIDNGNETEWILSPDRIPHYRAVDLLQAAAIIQSSR